MNEEEKKAIEILEAVGIECNGIDVYKIIKNLIEKQQKELEQEKEKNKENIECIEEWINGERVSINCIHKDKVKEKIEEIKNYTFTSKEERQCQNYAIDRLKELMEVDNI